MQTGVSISMALMYHLIVCYLGGYVVVFATHV